MIKVKGGSMLDYKDNFLLNLLISTDYTLNISDVQNLLGVSKRSVYYSMDKINDFLVENGLPKLENKREIGIVIDPITRDRLVEVMTENIVDSYILTPQERVILEVLILLCMKDNINIPLFEDLFDVSRNTIVKDIAYL